MLAYAHTHSSFKMRPLNEEEMRTFFSKLSKYIGGNVKLLLDRSDGSYVFRLNKGRVYYVKEAILKKAMVVAKKNLISMGACFGKFTKSNKFHLHVTALDYIAPYAQQKIWVKSSSEQQFLYGNNILKSGVSRTTDINEQFAGVVVYNMADVPLGFGLVSRSAYSIGKAELSDIFCIHQADIGEYLRNEDTLI